jgi:hypothetical protein
VPEFTCRGESKIYMGDGFSPVVLASRWLWHGHLAFTAGDENNLSNPFASLNSSDRKIPLQRPSLGARSVRGAAAIHRQCCSDNKACIV